MYLITFVLGDVSNDGHGMTESYAYWSNKPREEIETAYANAVEGLAQQWGREFSRQLRNMCSDYEDSSFPALVRTCLRDSGVISEEMNSLWGQHNWRNWGKRTDYENVPWIPFSDTQDSNFEETKQFTDVWIAIARYGDPDLAMQEAETEEINIDGYGLFGS